MISLAVAALSTFLPQCVTPAQGSMTRPSVTALQRPDANYFEFPIYLRSGATVSSGTEPRIAFGRVEFTSFTGEVRSLLVQEVHLKASQSAWAELTPWANLDQHPQQGVDFPAVSFVDARSQRATVPSSEAPLHLVELWKEWCYPCRVQLETLRAWFVEAVPPGRLNVTTLCVGCKPDAWKRILHERKLEGAPGWTNGLVEPTDWLVKTMGERAKVNFLLDSRGRVVHSRMEPHPGGEPLVLKAVVRSALSGHSSPTREVSSSEVSVDHRAAASAEPSAARAPTASVGSAYEPPAFVNLNGAFFCTSEATQITFKSAGGEAVRVARILSKVAGRPVESDVDMTRTIVEAEIESIPWDCIVEELAKQMGLRLIVEPERIRLVVP